MSEKVAFVLGDKLPTYYDAAISIYIVATKPKSKKMVSTINLQIYGRDPLVIFMLQVEGVLLITFKLNIIRFMLKFIVNLKSIKRM